MNFEGLIVRSNSQTEFRQTIRFNNLLKGKAPATLITTEGGGIYLILTKRGGISLGIHCYRRRRRRPGHWVFFKAEINRFLININGV